MSNCPILILFLNMLLYGHFGSSVALIGFKIIWGHRATVTAITIAVILFASNFTVINAQQSLTSQPGGIENGTAAATVPTTTATTFQSTNDSFGVQVPQGWVIHDVNNTGSTLLEEATQGYGVLAQLCPEKEEQQQGAALPNASGCSTNASSSNNSTVMSVKDLKK